MLNAKTGVILALVGLLAGHYAYLHDLLNGAHLIMMGPITWTIAGVSFLAAAWGLWLIWRENPD